MKNQALFSSKDKSKKFKCRLLQFLFDVLRVKAKYLNARVPRHAPYNKIICFVSCVDLSTVQESFMRNKC